MPTIHFGPPMLQNLATGTLMIILTVLIHTFGLIAVTRVMTHATDRFRMHGHRSRVIAMISVVFGLFLVLTVEVWLWAACYWVLEALPDFADALYFSTVSFSTVGFGDVIPKHQWRLLGRAGGGERLSDDRLVHRLPDRRLDPGRPVPQRRAFLSLSVRQEQVACLAVKEMLGEAAEHQLAQARMRIGAHDQQIGILRQMKFLHFLRRVLALRQSVDLGLDAMFAQIGLEAADGVPGRLRAFRRAGQKHALGELEQRQRVPLRMQHRRRRLVRQRDGQIAQLPVRLKLADQRQRPARREQRAFDHIVIDRQAKIKACHSDVMKSAFVARLIGG